MISHIHIGTNDLMAAKRFYQPLMVRLGWRLRFCDLDRGWAGWEPAEGGRPLFLLGRPQDGGIAAAGNGTMVALLALDRTTVDDIHRMAIGAGAANEGDPGLRPHYHPDYYGAYFRDLDGNKICVCCHAAPID
ncbi:VOC family protein [Xanthobacter oligotrophicus]|uniref:VOC family protein n=1 Tax=Xanthobacter oligotrophicus TaxID=2607286 RepID=UPI0011F3DBA1|nr:VOC family protein [Xanthobacter oligotrophicus]MCG5237890.1 VOC family protein [Xanthobacter oligotrophicus]